MVDASFEANGPFDGGLPVAAGGMSLPSTLATGGRMTIASGGYAYVSGFANGNFYAGSSPFSLRACIRPTNAANGASQALLGIWQQGNQAASQWMLYLTATGGLAVAWMNAQPVLLSATATQNPVFPTNNTPLWVRADIVPLAGTCTFYTSIDGATWAQLGMPINTGVVGPVQAIGTATTFVLGQAYAGSLPFAGDLYQAQLWISGVLVSNPTATAQGLRDSGGYGWITSSTLVSYSASILGSVVDLRGAVLYNPNWPYWAEFWSKWDWFGYIKPCIDASARLGANCIKFNADGLADNGFSYPGDTVFQARFHQLCSYAGSLGMVVYLQIGYQPAHSFSANGSTVSAGTAAAVKIAGWAEQESNVVAIDTLNEWDISQPSTWGMSGTGLAQAISDLTGYVAAIRAVSSKPLTISSLSPANWQQIAGIVDYHDVHYYYYNNASNTAVFDPTVVNAMRNAPAYRGTFILGETGMPSGGLPPTSLTAAQQQAWMAAVPQVANLSDCVGACHWTLVDTYGPSLQPGNWGMFAPGLVGGPRPQLAAGFQTWPKRLA